MSANLYTVNALGDSGAGSGTSSDIRYCISQADLNAGSTISFASSLSGQTLALTHGQLAITDNMTITGLGPTSLTISSGHLSRVFDISAKTAQVNISSLTIIGGSLAGEGGGLYNAGTLTLNDDAFSGNSAKYGGGIFTVSGSTLTIKQQHPFRQLRLRRRWRRLQFRHAHRQHQQHLVRQQRHLWRRHLE